MKKGLMIFVLMIIGVVMSSSLVLAGGYCSKSECGDQVTCTTFCGECTEHSDVLVQQNMCEYACFDDGAAIWQGLAYIDQYDCEGAGDCTNDASYDNNEWGCENNVGTCSGGLSTTKVSCENDGLCVGNPSYDGDQFGCTGEGTCNGNVAYNNDYNACSDFVGDCIGNAAFNNDKWGCLEDDGSNSWSGTGNWVYAGNTYNSYVWTPTGAWSSYNYQWLSSNTVGTDITSEDREWFYAEWTDTTCGDGNVEPGEECDDGNTDNNDGCNWNCEIEPGYFCVDSWDSATSKTTSTCHQSCGDALEDSFIIMNSDGSHHWYGESCDDGNAAIDDGCSDHCMIEYGWSCTEAFGPSLPSVCTSVCGDGTISGSEECDDGNNVYNDGCSGSCEEEDWSGYTCTGTPSICTVTCGNGVVDAGWEECDDGNNVYGDGCNNCEVGWNWHLVAGVLTAGKSPSCDVGESECCGDGVLDAGEFCDTDDEPDLCHNDCADYAGALWTNGQTPAMVDTCDNTRDGPFCECDGAAALEDGCDPSTGNDLPVDNYGKCWQGTNNLVCGYGWMVQADIDNDLNPGGDDEFMVHFKTALGTLAQESNRMNVDTGSIPGIDAFGADAATAYHIDFTDMAGFSKMMIPAAVAGPIGPLMGNDFYGYDPIIEDFAATIASVESGGNVAPFLKYLVINAEPGEKICKKANAHTISDFITYTSVNGAPCDEMISVNDITSYSITGVDYNNDPVTIFGVNLGDKILVPSLFSGGSVEYCGDGITNASLGEQCDDGGLCSDNGAVCNVGGVGMANCLNPSNATCIGQNGDGCDENCQNEAPAAVPEFSDYAIALLLLTVVGGFVAMRRKQY